MNIQFGSILALKTQLKDFNPIKAFQIADSSINGYVSQSMELDTKFFAVVNDTKESQDAFFKANPVDASAPLPFPGNHKTDTRLLGAFIDEEAKYLKRTGSVNDGEVIKEALRESLSLTTEDGENAKKALLKMHNFELERLIKVTEHRAYAISDILMFTKIRTEDFRNTDDISRALQKLSTDIFKRFDNKIRLNLLIN